MFSAKIFFFKRNFNKNSPRYLYIYLKCDGQQVKIILQKHIEIKQIYILKGKKQKQKICG
jgi:hypothetical protein